MVREAGGMHAGANRTEKPIAVPRAPGPIIMVRHGRPDLARKAWLSARGWDDWWATYERTGLAYGEHPPRDLVEVAAPAVHRLSSPLPRARETARAIFGPVIYDVDPLFVEAPLPAPRWPGFIRFSSPVWKGISRVLWLMGYAGRSESRRLATLRAVAAADRLEEAARDGLVVLCGHGWFNRMIRGVLVQRGWVCNRDGGDNFWSWRRLVREDALRDVPSRR